MAERIPDTAVNDDDVNETIPLSCFGICSYHASRNAQILQHPHRASLDLMAREPALSRGFTAPIQIPGRRLVMELDYSMRFGHMLTFAAVVLVRLPLPLLVSPNPSPRDDGVRRRVWKLVVIVV